VNPREHRPQREERRSIAGEERSAIVDRARAPDPRLSSAEHRSEDL
jgi:hypothetical protein